jgi:membrane-associated phospholipid phosphatase
MAVPFSLRALVLAAVFGLLAVLPGAAEELQKPGETPPPSADSGSPGTSFFQLLLADGRATVLAPAHWNGRDWGLFSLSVAGVAAASLADGRVRSSELHDHNRFANAVADDFEPLGSYASFGVLGAFYLGGLAAHDDRARAVGEDGLIAVLISGGVVTSGLKLLAGRQRPRATSRTYDFHPFQGGASFPSGHATQAFAVASVIAYDYDSPWIRGAAYGSAALVGFARIHHQAHFLSDVVAGGLIGTAVGRTVAANGRARRASHHLTFVPVAGPRGEAGVGLALAF